MRACFINVYKCFGNGKYVYSDPHPTRDDADMYAGGHRIYLIRVRMRK